MRRDRMAVHCDLNFFKGTSSKGDRSRRLVTVQEQGHNPFKTYFSSEETIDKYIAETAFNCIRATT